MFNSKALKPGNPWDRKEPSWRSKLRELWHEFPLVKLWDNTRWIIRRAKRLLHWSKFMWTNWDFDATSIWPLLEYKLKRVQHCLQNGHAIQEPKDMKALRIAIKLAGRISNDYHEERFYARHKAKWGDFKSWFTPCLDKPGMSEWHSFRSNAVTEQEKEQERSERLEGYRLSELFQARDEKLCLAIIQKYHRVWWD